MATYRKIAAHTPQKIAARAYAFWQAEGCPEGRAMEHWLMAEQLLAAEALRDKKNKRKRRSLAEDRPADFPGLNAASHKVCSLSEKASMKLLCVGD